MARIKCKRLRSLEGLDLPLFELSQDAKILLAFQSPYQEILIIRFPNGKKGLMLDGEIQYVEGENSKDYHLKHVKLLYKCPYAAKRVAIVGGGDGILAGEILKKFPHARIDLYELDPCMVYVYRKYETKVNNNALNDPRVRVIIGDAFRNIQRVKDGFYTSMFVDLPDAIFDNRLDTLYTPYNFQLLARKLALGGCMSIYTGGINPDFMVGQIIPDCMQLLGKEVAYGFLGYYGIILHLRKIIPQCNLKTMGNYTL